MSGPRAFPLGELTLDSGPVLAEATIGYRVWGRLDAGGTNAILLPGQFPGMGAGWTRLIGPGRVLDPERHFIISVDLIGDGLSSAPSQTPGEASRAAFASVTRRDNLRAQRRLVTALGVTRLALVAGWSIAGAQAITWAAVYPEVVGAVLAVCAASGPNPERAGLLSTLLDLLEGRGDADQMPGARLRAFGAVLADWMHSPEYYALGLFRDDGFASAEQAREAWELAYLAHDPADLAVALRCWAGAGDPGGVPLDRIRARAMLMACAGDRLCPPAEVAREAALIPGARTRLIASPFGHGAGRPGAYAEETALVEGALADLLG